MAYNKAREETKWLLWKEAEEKNLRQFGVDEDVIQKIRAFDWENFKSERRFYERLSDADTYITRRAVDEISVSIRTAQDLLDDIDSEELHRVLLSVDKLTLQIAIWRMDGYPPREIAKRLSLTNKAVYRKICKLKEKIKKIL